MRTKKCAIKQNLNFEVYKHCLEARNQKKILQVGSLRENHKEFIKIKRLILKSQQQFRCE